MGRLLLSFQRYHAFCFRTVSLSLSLEMTSLLPELGGIGNI